MKYLSRSIREVRKQHPTAISEKIQSRAPHKANYWVYDQRSSEILGWGATEGLAWLHAAQRIKER